MSKGRTDPFKHLAIESLYRELRKLRFKRKHRSRTKDDPHIYERPWDPDVLLSAQLWPDGRHRLSHSYKGYEKVSPTEFGSTWGALSRAFEEQVSLIAATREHYEKCQNESGKERLNDHDRPEEEVREV